MTFYESSGVTVYGHGVDPVGLTTLIHQGPTNQLGSTTFFIRALNTFN